VEISVLGGGRPSWVDDDYLSSEASLSREKSALENRMAA
jgi:hypothetical protein